LRQASIGHHDAQGVALSEAPASPARRGDHAPYLVWRQVFTAEAGVVWLVHRRLSFLRFAENDVW